MGVGWSCRPASQVGLLLCRLLLPFLPIHGVHPQGGPCEQGIHLASSQSRLPGAQPGPVCTRAEIRAGCARTRGDISAAPAQGVRGPPEDEDEWRLGGNSISLAACLSMSLSTFSHLSSSLSHNFILQMLLKTYPLCGHLFAGVFTPAWVSPSHPNMSSLSSFAKILKESHFPPLQSIQLGWGLQGSRWRCGGARKQGRAGEATVSLTAFWTVTEEGTKALEALLSPHYHQETLTLCCLAAKSLQSCPTLCNPIDGSPPGTPSLGFSRQENQSGLPFPSPMRESEVIQSCPTLHDPMDCSPPVSSVHGIFQARVLEWGATAFSLCCPNLMRMRRALEAGGYD